MFSSMLGELLSPKSSQMFVILRDILMLDGITEYMWQFNATITTTTTPTNSSIVYLMSYF